MGQVTRELDRQIGALGGKRDGPQDPCLPVPTWTIQGVQRMAVKAKSRRKSTAKRGKKPARRKGAAARKRSVKKTAKKK